MCTSILAPAGPRCLHAKHPLAGVEVSGCGCVPLASLRNTERAGPGPQHLRWPSALRLEVGVWADSCVKRKRKMRQGVSFVTGQVEATHTSSVALERTRLPELRLGHVASGQEEGPGDWPGCDVSPVPAARSAPIPKPSSLCTQTPAPASIPPASSTSFLLWHSSSAPAFWAP